MEQILDLPVQEKQELNYAGFWIRFVAVFIDGILLLIVQFGLSYIFYGGFAFGGDFRQTIISNLIGIIYAVAMMGSRHQATLGKMAVGIKVGNADGSRITYGQAIGRYIATWLSAIVLLIGYLMVIWDKQKQSLHDKLANTYVYYEK
jgi:uncharacterized RDD family membrane protein YckC